MVEDVFGIVGTVIAGAYHVEAVVSDGGFGVVYRGHHDGSPAPVALKMLKVPQQNPEQEAELLNLLFAEAQPLFGLSASFPSVVRPLHVDAFRASDGRFVPYLALEWLEGQTLEALIRQRTEAGLPAVPLRKLVRLLTPVAQALERVHHINGAEGRGCILHGDLKPEKIFVAQVGGEELLKLLDLGMGRVKSMATQVFGRLREDGNAPTSRPPVYGAPEQWAPEQYGQTGPFTDVWSLALCLVRVIAGRPLLDPDPKQVMGIALDSQRRPTPRNEGVEVSDAVEAVFARALLLEPRARQGDVGIFWRELVAALQVSDVEPRARPSGLMSRVQPSAAVQRALAMDLEFDPLSAAQMPSVNASSVSGSHYVPDLEFDAPSVPRRASGAQVIQQPPVSQHGSMDLDDALQSTEIALDLDFPADEPAPRRTVSSQRMPAVRESGQQYASNPPPRGLSGLLVVVSEPLVNDATSGVTRTGSPNTLIELSNSEAPRALRASHPPSAAQGSPARRAPSVRPLPSPTPHARAPLYPALVAGAELNLTESRPLLSRLRPAMALLAAALLVAIVDPIYAATTGEVLKIFGLRLSLFAGALLMLSLGWGARELKADLQRRH